MLNTKLPLRLSIYKLDIRLNSYIKKYLLQLKKNNKRVSFVFLFKARGKQNGKNSSITTKLGCRAWIWNTSFFCFVFCFFSILDPRIELAHSSIDNVGELELFLTGSFPIPMKCNWYFNKFQCLLCSKHKIYSSLPLSHIILLSGENLPVSLDHYSCSLWFLLTLG